MQDNPRHYCDTGNSMAGNNLPERSEKMPPPHGDRVILLAGLVLLLLAIAVAGFFPLTPTNIIIIIALFGIGCATIWFGLIQPAVRTGGKRIEQINRKTDSIRRRISGGKKL